MTEVRRSPEGRVAISLQLGLDEPIPQWVAVWADHGQIQVELLDDDVVRTWEQL